MEHSDDNVLSDAQSDSDAADMTRGEWIYKDYSKPDGEACWWNAWFGLRVKLNMYVVKGLFNLICARKGFLESITSSKWILELARHYTQQQLTFDQLQAWSWLIHNNKKKVFDFWNNNTTQFNLWLEPTQQQCHLNILQVLRTHKQSIKSNSTPRHTATKIVFADVE